MSRYHMLFKVKMIALFMAAFIFVLATLHVILYITVKNIAAEQLAVTATGIAVSVAHYLSQDMDGYLAFAEERDVESAYYKQAQTYFESIKTAGDVRFIFTERLIDAQTIEFILDSEPVGDPNHSPPGTQNPIEAWREQFYATRTPQSFKLIDHHIWGELIAARAPLYDADGQFIGAVGVNIGVERLVQLLEELQTVMLAAYALIIALVLIGSTVYSDRILTFILKDKLTGAYRKRYLEKIMQTELEAAVKYSQHFYILLFDLDYFKKINDTYGHLFGDRVLADVSKLIRDHLRKSDCFIRYGGEEFVAILSDCNADQVLAVAERIREAVEENEIYYKEKDVFVRMTLSAGVAHLDGEADPHRLLENADRALYQAKVTRNRVCLYESG